MKTYIVPGEPRHPGAEPRKRATSGPKVDELITEHIESALNGDPELVKALALSYLGKKHGVKMEPGANEEQKRLFRYMDQNPHYEEQWAQAQLRKAGVRMRGEEDELSAAIKQVTKLAEAQKVLREAAGVEGGGSDGSFSSVLGEVIREGVKAFKEYRAEEREGGNVRGRSQRGELDRGISRPELGSGEKTGSPARSEVVEGRIRAIGQVEQIEQIEQIEQVEKEHSAPRSATGAEHHTSTGTGTGTDTGTDTGTGTGTDIPHDIDWGSLLGEVDWIEMEKGVRGDPGLFMQSAALFSLDEDGSSGSSSPYTVLIGFFAENSPSAILLSLGQAKEMVSRPMVRMLVAGLGRKSDLEALTRILDYLVGEEGGREWVKKAHAAAMLIRKRMKTQEMKGSKTSGDSLDRGDRSNIASGALRGGLDGNGPDTELDIEGTLL